MPLTIPANDHGLIRIFKVNVTATDGHEIHTPEALQALFGTDALDPAFVDVVDTRELAGLSLRDYLHQGYDLPDDALDDPALRDLRGLVIVMMSRATRGREMTLTLAPQVTHVTTFGDPVRLQVPAPPIATTSATGTIPGGKALPSNAAMSGRVATIALLVLFALVALMIWVAS